MTARTFGITFEGYWRDENESQIPSLSGIFCVYVCVDHPNTNEVLLNTLLYVGDADDLRKGIANHKDLQTWKKSLKEGEDLCYSFAHVPVADRDRCKSAIVFRHRPTLNTEDMRTFPFGQTTISLNGQISHLHPNFTVESSQ